MTEHTQYMTTADRHREEGVARLQDGLVCPHGRPAGFSNYDVRFCGECEREEYEEYLDSMARCPACGAPMDYCQGHGEIGDPYGHEVLRLHDLGIHNTCHADGCDEIDPENLRNRR